MTLRLIAPHIDTIAIKDFHWAQRADGRWEPRSVPIGDGQVDFAAYLRQLLAARALPPVTVHFEYAPLEMRGGGGAQRRRETIDGMRRDLDRFRRSLAVAQSTTSSTSTSPR